MTDTWYFNIDNGLTNEVLFMDPKKAFDTTDHEIVLSKLELYGFKGTTLNLLRNYLIEHRLLYWTTSILKLTIYGVESPRP